MSNKTHADSDSVSDDPAPEIATRPEMELDEAAQMSPEEQSIQGVTMKSDVSLHRLDDNVDSHGLLRAVYRYEMGHVPEQIPAKILGVANALNQKFSGDFHGRFRVTAIRTLEDKVFDKTIMPLLTDVPSLTSAVMKIRNAARQQPPQQDASGGAGSEPKRRRVDAAPRVADKTERAQAWQGDAPKPPLKGELATISGLDLAGLSDRGEEQHYVRPAMERQWNFLARAFDNRHTEAEGVVKHFNLLLVGGPPGTGKSSTTWLWCQWMARSKRQTVLWLHKAHGTGSGFQIRLLEADGIVTYRYGTDFTTPASRNTLIGDLTSGNNISVSVCVFDGVTADEDVDVREMLEGWLNVDRPDRLLVYCASVAVHLKAEAGAQRHSVPSWLREEYTDACHFKALWEAVQGVMGVAFTGDALGDGDADIDGGAGGGAAGASAGAALGGAVDGTAADRSLLIDSKFFIAGHCARWMFGLSTSEVVEDIATHISKVDSFADLLEHDMGESTKRQVNHLRATLAIGAMNRKPQNVFVSEYVARTLSQHGNVEVKFMNRLNRFANRSENPTFLGWCVEFDFLMQLRQATEADGKGVEQLRLAAKAGAHKTVSLRVGDLEVAWSVNRCRSFDTVDDVKAMKDLAADDWLIPMRFNQGTFDAVQLVNEAGGRGRLVRFINVTCAERHGVKSAYLYSMMKALQGAGWLAPQPDKPTLEFYFVQPANQRDDPFTADTPTPHGKLTSHFSWLKQERKHAFFKRTQG